MAREGSEAGTRLLGWVPFFVFLPPPSLAVPVATSGLPARHRLALRTPRPPLPAHGGCPPLQGGLVRRRVARTEQRRLRQRTHSTRVRDTLGREQAQQARLPLRLGCQPLERRGRLPVHGVGAHPSGWAPRFFAGVILPRRRTGDKGEIGEGVSWRARTSGRGCGARSGRRRRRGIPR